MRRRGGQYDQSGVVNVGIRHWSEASIGVVVCRRCIGKEHHSVIAEHCIPRRRMTAILCSGSRDDHRIGAPLTQYDIEVRSEKTAVAMLLDYVLTGCRGEIGVNFYSGGAVHQSITIGDCRVHVVEQPHVAAITAVHMSCVDHSDPSGAANL